MRRFTNIHVCIWDVDGTLYRPTERMSSEVRESAYRAIAECTHWDRKKVIEEFDKVHETVTSSSTEIVAILCGTTVPGAARVTDAYFNRKRFLSRDPKLCTLFEQLTGFRHFLLGNGTRKLISEALDVLGIPRQLFEEIVTSEIVGVNKPETAGFRYILEKTGLPPWQHLMIGDREHVDIVPAKAVGMKTCLVWTKGSGSVADVTLPTVYDLAQILV
jgi:FMN phosphatase YigB (HAD superfamily)